MVFIIIGSKRDGMKAMVDSVDVYKRQEQAGSTIAMGKKHIAMGEENLQ